MVRASRRSPRRTFDARSNQRGPLRLGSTRGAQWLAPPDSSRGESRAKCRTMAGRLQLAFPTGNEAPIANQLPDRVDFFLTNSSFRILSIIPGPTAPVYSYTSPRSTCSIAKRLWRFGSFPFAAQMGHSPLPPRFMETTVAVLNKTDRNSKFDGTALNKPPTSATPAHGARLVNPRSGCAPVGQPILP